MSGIFSSIGHFITGEVMSCILTALAVIVFSVFGAISVRIITTLKEAGEFMMVLANALQDRKITREELEAIIKEAQDVFNIFKKTPEKYQVK